MHASRSSSTRARSRQTHACNSRSGEAVTKRRSVSTISSEHVLCHVLHCIASAVFFTTGAGDWEWAARQMSCPRLWWLVCGAATSRRWPVAQHTRWPSQQMGGCTLAGSTDRARLALGTTRIGCSPCWCLGFHPVCRWQQLPHPWH